LTKGVSSTVHDSGNPLDLLKEVGVVDVPFLLDDRQGHIARGAEATGELVLGVDEGVLRIGVAGAGVDLEARLDSG
jgi:hypothetical protein